MDREECKFQKIRKPRPGDTITVDLSVEIEAGEDGTLIVRQQQAKIVIYRIGKKDEAETT